MESDRTPASTTGGGTFRVVPGVVARRYWSGDILVQAGQVVLLAGVVVTVALYRYRHVVAGREYPRMTDDVILVASALLALGLAFAVRNLRRWRRLLACRIRLADGTAQLLFGDRIAARSEDLHFHCRCRSDTISLQVHCGRSVMIGGTRAIALDHRDRLVANLNRIARHAAALGIPATVTVVEEKVSTQTFPPSENNGTD